MTRRTIPERSWHKSSYSQNNGGECVEWAPAHATPHGEIPVRDSKNPQSPGLTFTPAAWTAFVTAVKHGELGR